MQRESGVNPGTGQSAVSGYRWVQLAAAIACMVAIANLQYAWTLYVPEIEKVHGWSRASIQTSFTIFVIFQTWLTPIGGIFLDRFGPRVMVILGGICCGLSWYIDSFCELPDAVLRSRCRWRYRRGHGVYFGGERRCTLVRRSPWSRFGVGGCGFRRRNGTDDHSDCEYDQNQRLSGRVLWFSFIIGGVILVGWLYPARSEAGRGADGGDAHAEPPRLHAG